MGKENNSKNKKILTLNQLVGLLYTKYQSQNSVLVTGCFDLLHKAHKDFLIAAKAKGSLLLVGLESDKRVRKLKGHRRPINKWQKRAASLAKLEWIDFIFPLPEKFNTIRDYRKLLNQIKPNILAASENTPFLEIKQKLIAESGSKLFIYPFNLKYSTTEIIRKKINKAYKKCS